MKYLILALSLASVGAFSQTPKVKELSEDELNKKAVAVLKDAEIDKQLEAVPVFKKCSDKNKFDPAKNDPQSVQPNLDAAVDCFKKEISKTNSDEKLKEMAEKLNLQGYGLIQGKNVKEISRYLGDKMYKSMTGVDRSNADLKAKIDSMRFNNTNRRMVDQQDFLELYKTQLVKSALFEISRYCFEDFRYKNSSNIDDFSKHWATVLSGTAPKIDDLDDTGIPSFFPITQSDATYTDIANGISKDGNLKGSELKIFFKVCTDNIKLLCDEFKDPSKNKGIVDKDKNAQDAGKTTVSGIKGSKSCLVQSRLQEMRRAISNTDLVMKDWDKKTDKEIALTLDGGKVASFYDGGKTNPEASYDALTSHSSDDVLNGGANKNSKLDELAKECESNPDKEDCKEFLVVDDSFQKAQHNMDMELRLRREISLERVRQLKQKNDKSLAEYLEAEGYLDVLQDLKDKKIKPEDVEQRVSNALEAKRISALDALKNKMGKRQMTEKDAKADPTQKKDKIVANIKETKSERARLAQVVMFNNIITSNLSLKDEKGNDLGQNMNAWKTEDRGLEKSKVSHSLFTNLRKQADDAPKAPNTAGSSVLGTGLLDTILGSTEDLTKKKK